MFKKNIYLTGFMGSGKSTIGPILANTLGWDFYDLDKVIEQRRALKVKDVFISLGEENFRELEFEILNELSVQGRRIISLGGGTITAQKNLELMKVTGCIIYLMVSSEEAFKRLKYKRDRPVLFSGLDEDFTDEDLHKNVERIMNNRKSFYEQADIHIDTDNQPVGRTVDFLRKIIMKEVVK